MPILKQDFESTHYPSTEDSIDIFYLSTDPLQDNSDLDIEYLNPIPSPLSPHIKHVGMLYDDMTQYQPTQDESTFVVTLITQVLDSDEEIMEALIEPDYPLDHYHHRSYFLPQSINPLLHIPNQYTIETKYFIPPGNIDWF